MTHVGETMILDLQEMPNFNPNVPNGADSVTAGLVYENLVPNKYGGVSVVECVRHGAMNAVSQDRTIWRCLACNEGAYVPRPSDS